MTSKEHKKHSDIARPSLGNFGRNEFSFIGTTCTNVKAITDHIIRALSASYKCAYLDADHKDKADIPEKGIQSFIEYTDKIDFRTFNYKDEISSFGFRHLLNETDLVLVNGNHFEAARQVVIIDTIKQASLLKRIHQITNPVLILIADAATEISDFVKEAVPQWQTLPVILIKDTSAIIDFFIQHLQQAVPVLNGLVLAGGKSTRMGIDKGTIQWHGRDQKYYMADLLSPICRDIYISCRQDQIVANDSAYKSIADSFTGLGPYGAILSAFREQPDAAWLVTACDLPLLDAETLQQLINNRNTSAIATTFESPYDGLPEPLITIWEPKAYTVLLSFLSQGYSCPRKVLRNSHTHLIKAKNPHALQNVNTPEEMAAIKANVQFNLLQV